MLSVGKLAAGPTAGRYYEDAVALGREDYYASEGEWSGRWLGAGADALGLDGEVQDGHVMRLTRTRPGTRPPGTTKPPDFRGLRPIAGGGLEPPTSRL
jgi:hypothetical protein